MMPTKTPKTNSRSESVERAEGRHDSRRAMPGSVADTNRSTATARVQLVGFDWGTNTSVVFTEPMGDRDAMTKFTVPTIVGYASEGIVDGVLPGDARMLFGQEALKHRMHLRLVQPMIDGVVHDRAASRDFARHLSSLINVSKETEIRAVIGMPANADSASRESMREVVSGLFGRVILIPEPFLAALGYRDETRLSDPRYYDPVKNSIFVDIGAGTTDVCVIQGYFPTAADQVSFPFAGDKVDQMISDAVKKTYPDTALSMLKIREIKENLSFVGESTGAVETTVAVGGKLRKLDLGAHVNAACGELLHRIFDAVRQLISRVPSDNVTETLQNIILTGGGSRIRNLDKELQRLLMEDGYEQPRVHRAGDDYKEYVARGALKAARSAREDQWQRIIT